MTIALLILHGLAAVLLLGALTHQAASCLGAPAGGRGFAARYRGIDGGVMVNAVVAAYLLSLLLGAFIYPVYRLEVRFALAELRLPWAIGLFEVKEHWSAIGLAALPLYHHLWRSRQAPRARAAVTLLLAVVVWFNFIVGHLLNNLRGV